MALSIFVPIGYITVLVISLSIFSRVYRKRTAQALVREHGQPWFPEGHPERDIYQTLVQASATANGNDGKGGGASVVPDVVLKAALLNRAMADVRRIIRLRDDKQALGVLLQKGSIGDETMAKFAMAEKELEAEILDVVSEANTFREGWGQLIFPTASEMVSHLKHKDIYYGISHQREEELKKLVEAGQPIPRPNVTLPPLMTPAGTSITIQAPSHAGGAPQAPLANGSQQGSQKLAAVSAEIAASGKGDTAAQTVKSGTVEEAHDESVKHPEELADSIPATLEEYADLDSPTAYAQQDEDSDEDMYGEHDDFDDMDSDYDQDDGGVIELIFKDPTPNPSPESAIVNEFVKQQTSKSRAAAAAAAASASSSKSKDTGSNTVKRNGTPKAASKLTDSSCRSVDKIEREEEKTSTAAKALAVNASDSASATKKKKKRKSNKKKAKAKAA